MGRLRSLSFRAQLMLLVTLSLLPALGLILYSAKERRDDALREARAEASLEAAQATRGPDLAIQTAQTMLASLAASPDLPRATSDTCSETLAKTLAASDPKAGLGQLWVAAPDGAVMCSANPTPPGLNVAAIDAFRVARETGRPFVGDFVNDPVAGAPSVVVARPTVDASGRVTAVLGTSFDFSRIGSDILGVSPGHIFLILDRQGNVLVHAPRRSDLLGKPVPSQQMHDAVVSQSGSGSAEFTAYDGVERLYSYLPFVVGEGANPYAVLGKPTSEVYASSTAALRRNLVWLAIVSVLAFGGAWVIGDVLFLRRVKALIAGTRTVAAGTFSERIPVGENDRDELARVARSFNEMTAQIEQRARGLRESEALYRSLFESTSDGMTIADTEGRLVRANQAFCAMHGYTEEEVLASGVLPLIAPEHRGQFAELVAAAGQGLPCQLRAVDVRRDGSRFPVDVRGTPVPYLGQPHYLTLVRDITSVVENEQALEGLVAERTHEIATILDVSRSLSSTLDLDELLDTILGRLREVVGYSAAAIQVLEGGRPRVLRRDGPPLPSDANNGAVDIRAPGARVLRRALRDGRVVVIDDVRGDSEEAVAYRSLIGDMLDTAFGYVVSWLAVPLRSKGETFGYLAMATDTPGFYTPERVRIAAGLGDYIATTIENARLFAETESRRRQLATLLDVSRSVASTLELQPLLRLILEQLRAVIPYAGSAVFVFEPGGIRILESASASGPEPEATGLFLAEPPGNWALDELRAGHAIRSTNVRGDDDYARAFQQLLGPLIDERSFRYIRSQVAVPLLAQDQVVGAMTVSRREEAAFSADDIELARAFASQAAVALQNARAFAQREQRLRETEAMASISSQLTLNQPMRRTLDEISAGVCAATGAGAASITLFDDEQAVRLSAWGSAGLPEGFTEAVTAVFAARGSSPAGCVRHTRRPTVIAGVREQLLEAGIADDVAASLRSADWQSAIVFPLQYHETFLGTLNTFHAELEPLTASRAPIFSAIADQVSAAVQNARLFVESERRRGESETLARIASSLTFERSLQEVLDAMANEVLKSTGAVASAILLREDPGMPRAMGGAAGLPEGYLDTFYRLAGANEADVDATNYWSAPAVIPGARTLILRNPAFAELWPVFETAAWDTVVRVPFVYHQESRGTVVLYYRTADTPGPGEFPFLQAIASQTAVAVENARLYMRSERRREESEALARMAATLTFDKPLSEVLNLLAGDVVYGTAARAAAIILNTEDSISGAIGGSSGLPVGYLEAAYRMFAAPGAAPESYWTERSIAWNMRSRSLADPTRAVIHPYLEQADWDSVVRVPFVYRERARGLLVLYYRAGDEPTSADFPYLEAIAAQASVAVENARLFAEVGDRSRQLEALYRADEQLHRSLRLEEVLHSLAEVAVAFFRADRALILFWPDGPAGEAEVRQAAGVMSDEVAQYMSVSRRDRARAGAYDPGTLRVENRVEGSPGAALARSAGILSFMEVPIRVDGRVAGLFTVGSSRAGDFPEEDQRTFVALTHRAELAIENARLFGQVGDRNRELETLYRADQELHRSLRLDDVLRALLDVVGDMLGADHSAIITWEAGLARPSIIASRTVDADAVDRLTASLARDGRERTFAGSLRIGRDDVIVIEDTLQSDWPPERAVGLGIRSVIEIPVWVQGELFAILTAAYRRPRAFPVEERRIYLALAHRAALAIENARLYEQAQSLAAIEERQRLARELHDSVSQALYGIALGAKTARTLLDRDPSRVKEPVEYVLSLAEAGLAEMRALIFELRPESLEGEGLIAAIGKQVAATRARYQVAVDDDLCPEPVTDLPVKEAIYRICQEGLHNIVKHAHATHVRLRLTCDAGRISLELRDDGTGFDPAGDFPGHLGLRSMRERATRLGGELEIESAPGKGTTLRAWVPLA